MGNEFAGVALDADRCPAEPSSTTAGADEFDAWAELVAQNFVPLAIRPTAGAARFDGTLAAMTFGDMHVGRVVATPHAVYRDQHHRDQGGSDDVKVSFVLSGEVCLEQGELVDVVRPGTAAMYDCGGEYQLRMDEPFSLLVLQTGRAELERRVATDLRRALVFEKSNVFARALWSIASGMCTGVEPAGDDTGLLASRARFSLIGDHMLDLLALAIADQSGDRIAEGTTRRELHMRSVSHITRHLADPRLSPRSVAEAVGVSQRTLHSLFHDSGDTVMEFIIRQRLERAHAELADTEGHGHRTVTEIAMSWGFKSASHFTRRFSEHFGRTPSDVRVTAPS